MNNDDRYMAMMWLEYASEGHKQCLASTGLGAWDAVEIAYLLLQGPVEPAGYARAKERSAQHFAESAIANARLQSKLSK